MKAAICTLSMMPMRREARHASEMVSMVLFGEHYQILESKENWHRIQTLHDSYEGWLTARRPRLVDSLPESAPYLSSGRNDSWQEGSGNTYLNPGSPLPSSEENFQGI